MRFCRTERKFLFFIDRNSLLNPKTDCITRTFLLNLNDKFRVTNYLNKLI